MSMMFWKLGRIEELSRLYRGKAKHQECYNGQFGSCSFYSMLYSKDSHHVWPNKRIPWFDQVGGKHSVSWRIFSRLLSKGTLGITSDGLLFSMCVSWDVHLMKCYCHLTTSLFSFLIWVWYWNILPSRETLLIKSYNMSNVCKWVRHIFQKVKGNWFLVLPDVFVACRNSIWSEWQKSLIHPFIPVIWYTVPLHPLGQAPASSGSVMGLCSLNQMFTLPHKLFRFLKCLLRILETR